MKYIIHTLFLLAFICINVNAQDKGLLKAEGKIPKEFITPSTDKYKKKVNDLNSSKTKSKAKKKRDKKRFLLESSFSIDDILQSGMVLFNDPASVYVNKVLGKLPYKEEPKLAKKNPRAYILNSAAVNAFATDQGIIFVTLGLLANLENEAQLAFILSHELVHIKNQHAINKFVNAKDIDRKEGRARNAGKVKVDRNIFKKSMYSRKLEEEADEEGLEIFLKSDYDPKAILNTFKILHYSYLPFDEVPFEKSFFEDTHYKLEEKFWLNEVKAISDMDVDDEEEESSSHPSSLKRLAKLESSVPAVANNKSTYLFPEIEFKTIRDRARNQLPFLNLYAENFPQSIYTSFLLLRNDPDNFELQKVIAKSLYMESKLQNYYQTNSTAYKEIMEEIVGKVEGESQRVYHLLTEMRPKDLNILALKYAWKVYRQNKEDEEMKMVLDDTFIEFSSYFGDLKDFATAPPAAPVENALPDTTNTELSKLDKIDRNIKANENYWKYAFVDELKDPEFKTIYDRQLEKHEERKARDEYYESREGYRELKKEYADEEKKGKRLGIKKVVVVNPFYLSLDDRKENTVQYVRSEEKQAYFRNAIREVSKKSNIKATILDVTDLSTNDIEKFNDIAEVNNYLSQQMDHFDLSLTPGYNQSEVNAIAEKYGTDFFLWTGVISLRERNMIAGYVALSIIMPLALPYTIPKMLKPEYDMLYYAMLFDVKTGRRSVIKMDYFDKRDNKSILKAHIYDTFFQINEKGK